MCVRQTLKSISDCQLDVATKDVSLFLDTLSYKVLLYKAIDLQNAEQVDEMKFIGEIKCWRKES